MAFNERTNRNKPNIIIFVSLDILKNPNITLDILLLRD